METEPTSADPIAVDAKTVLPWAEARTRLAAAQTYWLGTVRSDGGPHVRPVLAVWVDGALYSSSSPRARKYGNIAREPRCALSTSTQGLDLVVEGDATVVRDHATLERVAEAYASKYEWPVTVRNGAFEAAYGAPTAGPPPYEIYVVRPTVVFGFGTDEAFAPRSTRWRFAPRR